MRTTIRGTQKTGRRHCEVDFRNNVIYNWGSNSCYDGTASYINWVNNYYKAGPATKAEVRNRIFQLSDQAIAGGPDNKNNKPEDSGEYETSLYANGNYMEGFPRVSADNWSGGIVFDKGSSEAKNRAQQPFNFPVITSQTALKAFPLVVAGAGASLVRDAIDQRIAKEVLSGTTMYKGSKSGTPGIIDSQKDVGGWPDLISKPAPADSDQDGMPDAWELQNHLNPKDPDDRNGDPNKNGYSNLEEYLNSIAPIASTSNP